jgi:hypothetical protein
VKQTSKVGHSLKDRIILTGSAKTWAKKTSCLVGFLDLWCRNVLGVFYVNDCGVLGKLSIFSA